MSFEIFMKRFIAATEKDEKLHDSFVGLLDQMERTLEAARKRKIALAERRKNEL